VARFYRSDLSQNAPISSEITGYSVSFLVYTYERTNDRKYLNAAVRGARYLTRVVWNKRLRLFPFEPSSPLVYFFDSGIIVRGLLAAWRATQDSEFLDVATAAGRGMLRHFPFGDHLPPIISLPSAQPLPYEPRWSASPGCYQLKSDVTRDPAFLEGYEQVLAAALRDHESFLPGDPNPDRVMDRLHAYCYFLEGLLPVRNRPKCRAAAHFGMERVAALLREIAPQFARSDVYAQLLRVRLLHSAPDPVAIAEEAAAAGRFQLDSGGFGFGLRAGAMMPFVNPVSTAFCAQALDIWAQSQQGSVNTDLSALV
jgi:AcrR family transcriptional regulator